MEDITLKENSIREVLNKIYDMFLYTDKNMGQDDYTYLSDLPYYKMEERNGLIALKEIHDNYLVEPELHIKYKNLKAVYTYGSWSCVKTKSCGLHIYKDKKYDGDEKATLDDIFKLLDRFIESNHFFVSSSNEHEIYDNNNNVLNKDSKIDLIDYNYLKEVSINNIDISKSDIEAMQQRLKKLRVLRSKNCKFDNNVNLSILPINLFSDTSSTLSSLDIFDYASFTIGLYQTIIKSNFNNILHLNSTKLEIDEVEMDYNLFFLKTDASKLEYLKIKNNNPLNDNDLKFITGFYNLEEIDIYAVINSYDFLYKLDKLRSIGNYLYNMDEHELNNTKEKQQLCLDEMQKSHPEYFLKSFNLNNYLTYHRWLTEIKNQTFYKQIRVPRISQVKWQDRLLKDEKDTVNDLVNIKKMSYKERIKIGTEEKIDLIARKSDDYLVKLGFIYNADKESKEVERYQTLIYGPNGQKLLRDIPLRDFSYKKPILDASGNLLCVMDYREEKTVNIPNHMIEVIYEKRADGNPNLTNYYNQFNKHAEKANYLSDMLIKILSKITATDIKYQKTLNKFIHQKNVISLIDEYETYFINEYFILFFSDSCFLSLIEKDVDENVILESTNEFLSECDYDENEAHLFKKGVLKYYKYMGMKRDILKRNFKVESIINGYLNELNKDIIKEINMDKIKDYVLSDIDEIALKYNLSFEQHELLKYFILYLQEQYNLALSNQISNVNDTIFGCNEEVGCLYNWPAFNEIMDKEGIDGALKKGMISKKDYRLLCKLSFAEDILKSLKSKQEDVYLKRIEAMYARLDLLNQLTMEDILNIKKMIPIVNEYAYDKDAIYIDQLIRYIDGDYPSWVKRDMKKLPSEEANYDFTCDVHRTYKRQSKIKLKAKKTEIDYNYPF